MSCSGSTSCGTSQWDGANVRPIGRQRVSSYWQKTCYILRRVFVSSMCVFVVLYIYMIIYIYGQWHVMIWLWYYTVDIWFTSQCRLSSEGCWCQHFLPFHLCDCNNQILQQERWLDMQLRILAQRLGVALNYLQIHRHPDSDTRAYSCMGRKWNSTTGSPAVLSTNPVCANLG